jgi:hypothetical protein
VCAGFVTLINYDSTKIYEAPKLIHLIPQLSSVKYKTKTTKKNQANANQQTYGGSRN